MSTFGITLDLGKAFARLDADAASMEAAARPAAQAGAEVLYQAVKTNVGRLRRHTGNLNRSIYQAFSPEQSQNGVKLYRISWNKKDAPHGHLIEFGWIQRYVAYQGNDGQVRPLIRPGMDGQPRPGRHASRAQKDAYYVPLPGGPRQVPGKAFVRSAMGQFPKALEAMEERYLAELRKKGVIK